MLAKLFGKRSTGIVWLVTASILLFLLAGFFASYFLSHKIDLYSLVGYAVFIVLALVLVTLPAFVQKTFKLYIPPFIQTGLCVYALLYLVNDLLRARETDEELALVQVSFLPAIGGFFLCAAIFAIIFSFLRARAERKQLRLHAWAVALVTLCVTTVLLLLINLPSLFITLPPFSHGTGNVTAALVNAAGYEIGALIFCLTGWVTVQTGKADWFTIRSFRRAERLKSEAVRRKDRTLLTVVENMERDATDYRKLYHRARRHFYLVRLVFLVFYAVYLVFSCASFYKMGKLGYVLIALNALGFLLTAAVCFYEFLLFSKDAYDQRLRKLNIARTSVKLYIFLQTLVSTVAANAHYLTLTALFAVIMAIVNLAVLFYNVFGKPRRYPPSPAALRRAAASGGADNADPPPAPDASDLPPASDTSDLQEQ